MKQPKPSDYKINPELIEALDHFGRVGIDPDPLKAHVFIATNTQRRQKSWSIEEACRQGGMALSEEDMAILKLRCLQDGMRRYGMDDMYRRIMGEDLPPEGSTY